MVSCLTLGETCCRSLPRCCLRILASNGSLHSLHVQDTRVLSNARRDPWMHLTLAIRIDSVLGFRRQKSGYRTCPQWVMVMDSIFALNWQQVCIRYPSIQPVSHRYQSGRRIVVHSTTVHRPDNAGRGSAALYLYNRWTLTSGPWLRDPGGQDSDGSTLMAPAPNAQTQEKRSLICSAVP